jgi:hypothetical protein
MITSLIVTAVLSVYPYPADESQPVISELPAEDVGDPSLPYLGSHEMDAAFLEVISTNGCPQWIATALVAGWEPADLPRLSRIMWRESRCLPDACGETDSPHIRKCRDWGLMQINDYSWKRIIREMGMSIEQMHDPYWNLWFARWLYEYSLERNDDGWVPWKFPPK